MVKVCVRVRLSEVVLCCVLYIRSISKQFYVSNQFYVFTTSVERRTNRPLTSQCDSSNTGNISRRTATSKQERLENWRQKFLSGLQSEGLEMEDVRNISSFFHQLYVKVYLQEYQDQGKQCLHFVKLHAPWTVISNMAMQLNLRAPIQVI